NGGSTANSTTGAAASASGSSARTTTSSSTGSKTGATSAGDTPGTSGTAAFITIQKVVRSNLDPNSLIELIGQNGDIGNNCQTVDQCECVFQWSEATGVLRNSPSPLLRRESNLARCSFLNVTAGVSFFDVTLHIKAANLASNTVRVFMPVANPSFDSSIGSNFLPIQRYMCRDIILKQNTQFYQAGANPLIDPQLWDQTYAFNFYTNSIGQDYGAVATSPVGGGPAIQVPGFECPPVPNDASDNAVYDYNIYSLGGLDVGTPNNLNVPDGLGDNTIFPSNDNKNLVAGCATNHEATCEKFAANRHDFYLSSFKSAVFHNSVCLIHKVANIAGTNPVVDCTGVDTATGNVFLGAAAIAGKDVVGWAAVPDQNERCPDPNAVKIPAGKKWAKLWRFRTTYAQRSVQNIANTGNIGPLFCTTREDSCQSNFPGVKPGAPGAVGAPPTPANKVPGTEDYTAGVQVYNTVCYNTRSPTGLGLPFQQTPAIGSGLQTDPGFGNCDMNGKAGDGNGPGNVNSNAGPNFEAGSPVAGPHGCQNGDYPVTHLSTGKCSTATDSCVSPNTIQATSFNCCNDLGNISGAAFNPTQRPANKTWGGQFCNPALIGDHDASSADIQTFVGDWPHGGYPDGNGHIVRGLAEDVWIMGNSGNHACIEADTDQGGALADQFTVFPPVRANAFQMAPLVLDTVAKADILYVVTPEAITVDQMQDSENGVIARQYTPYRLVQNGDASTRLVYQLESGSVNTPTATDRLSQFPICVLQDKVEGLIQGDPP
ncbi:MAG: hypothetical protein HY074_10650, partial [Deltaproteobacteria bacterium]|nr:hypothetical protein [Deltaproteobacteria bacterium]